MGKLWLVDQARFSQWNWRLNTVDPKSLSVGTHKRVWWQCDKGHEWDESVQKRITATHPCPVCLNKRIIAGVNDAASLHPHLVTEWSDTNSFTLDTVPPGSGKVGLWVCKLGHEWETSVRARANGGAGCLVCSGQRTLAGFNDLATVLPSLAAEFHPTKNSMTVDTVHHGSGYLVWWQCVEGHEWKATVDDRSKKKRGCPFCSGRNTVAGVTDIVTTHPDLAAEWDFEKNTLSPSDVSAGSSKKVWWKCSKGHGSWLTAIGNRKAGKGCPQCGLVSFTSKPELALNEFLEQFFVTMPRDRSTVSGHELDIYIPEKKFAIEYNGLYWHSEQFKDKNYHYDKWLACKEQGIQLIQIWEDDWKRDPVLVKRMLARKLDVSDEPVVYASNTFTKKLHVQEVRNFLAQNHIQGFATGSYYIGLFDKRDASNLVAVLNVKKEAGTGGRTLNIIRYATSVRVPGGFTKLLKYVEKEYKPERFITFSDNCVSDGGLYELNGFLSDKVIVPDYTYLVGGVRKHKFGYRLKRFSNDPDLQYEAGLTERELASLNGLLRVWDAGKTRWLREV